METFSKCTSASTVRTGPTFIINTTIYPDAYSAKKGLEKRTEWLKRYCNAITDTFFYEGDVEFATHEKNKSLYTPVVSNKSSSEQTNLESLEREVRGLKSMIRKLLDINK